MRVYEDSSLVKEVQENILYEGVSYYLDLSVYDSAYCKSQFEKSGIIKFLDWHPKNSIAVLQLINVVGFIQILDKSYDVRSRKLFSDKQGNNQFELLLAEINEISKGINFDYTGVTFSSRKRDELDLAPSLLERFEYYRQLVFSQNRHESLETLISFVLKNPHSKQLSLNSKKEISSVKRPAKKFIRHIRSADFIKLEATSELTATPLAHAINELTGQHLFLARIEAEERERSFDTHENQFIKLLLTDILSVCSSIISLKKVPDKVKLDALNVKEKVSRIFNNSFFQNISALRFFPNSSSVLTGRAGYRELYYHYIQSRFGFFNILDDLNRQALTTGLKDIATLYEIWTFFKVASVALGKDIVIKSQKRLFKNNNVAYGFVWSSGDVEVSYNLTYSLGDKNSYSLSLRPDITVKINQELYFFDAKYKIANASEFLQDTSSYFKAEDIHKMHCYLDAIAGSKAAFVLYTGSEFAFYPKKIFSKITSASELDSLEGVGAIPLKPNSEPADLEYVLNNILNIVN